MAKLPQIQSLLLFLKKFINNNPDTSVEALLSALKRKYGDDALGLFELASNVIMEKEEASLSSKEQYIKQIEDISSDGIMVLSLEGSILRLNSKLFKIFQLEPRELINKHFLSLVDEKYKIKWESAFNDCLTTDQGISFEYRLKSDDDSYKILEIHFQLITDSLKEKQIYVTISDNSELYLTKSKLRQSAKTFSAIANNMNEAILVVSNDDEIQYVNDKLLSLTGYKKTEMLGRLAKKMMLFEGDYERMQKIISERKKGESSAYEIRIKKKDGEAVWVNISGAPIYDKDNEIIGSVGIHQDISERRRYQKQLENISRFPRENPNPVFRFSKEGELLFVNKAADIILPKIFSKKESRLLKKEMVIMLDSLKENKIIERELVHKKRFYKLIYTPISSEGYVNIYGIDITKLKETNEMLVKAKLFAEQEAKSKELFLANMSHEIRTPMNGIMGVIQLLNGTDLNKGQKEYLRLLDFSAQNMLTIINDILDFSKIEAGKLVIDSVAFQISNVIQDTLDQYDSMARQKGLEVKLNLEKVSNTVIGDPVRLNQIMGNLISNAIKFTDKGSVEISCNEKASDNKNELILEVKIKDSGIGIPTSKLDKIFQLFEQVHSSTNKQGGTGLGLSIVKKLLELQGGFIRFESVEGKGSEFIFEIPYRVQELKIIEKAEANDFQDFRKTLKNCHMLLVEDNRINQMIARTFLTEFGAKVKIVENGREAIDELLAKKDFYEVILLDIQMPIMDGYETLHEINRLKLNHIPVITMTAHALKNEEVKCRELGVKEYITKPIKKEKLIETVVEIITKSRREDGEERENKS